jgi:hypothetical protein
VGPEGFLPGHLDAPAVGEAIEPALALGHILSIEYQGKAGVAIGLAARLSPSISSLSATRRLA